jgi:hypothetical protein
MIGQIKSIIPVKKRNKIMRNPYGSNFANTADCSGGRRWAKTLLPSRGGMGMALKTARIILIKTLTHSIFNRGVTMRPHDPGGGEAIIRKSMAETAANAKLVNIPAREIQIISLLGFLRL